MKLASIYGNGGLLWVDAATGQVVRYAPSGDVPKWHEGYADITAVDVEEWKRAYPGEEFAGGFWDVVDLGLWSFEGEYTPPESDWRQAYRYERPALQGSPDCFRG